VKIKINGDKYSVELSDEERDAFIEVTGQEPHEFIREKIAKLQE